MGVLAGVAQLVERQPSKLNVAGSSPVARLVRDTWRAFPGIGAQAGWGGVARVAQSVERILGKDEVTGSIPVASSWRAGSRRRWRRALTRR